MRRGRSPLPLVAVAFVLFVSVGAYFILRTPTAAPDDSSMCRAMSDMQERARCFDARAVAADQQELSVRLAGVSRADERDLIRLDAIAKDPTHARTWCPDMETDQAKALCERIRGRAHLWAGTPSETRVRRSGE